MTSVQVLSILELGGSCVRVVLDVSNDVLHLLVGLLGSVINSTDALVTLQFDESLDGLGLSLNGLLSHFDGLSVANSSLGDFIQDLVSVVDDHLNMSVILSALFVEHILKSSLNVGKLLVPLSGRELVSRLVAQLLNLSSHLGHYVVKLTKFLVDLLIELAVRV